MTYYPDLGTSTQIASAPHVRAIGWLGAGHEFPVGDIDEGVARRVRELCAAWQSSIEALDWGVFLGWHDCEFCGASAASGNLGIPSGDVLYVAPEMLAHYIDAHRYLPPAEFLAAVQTCPPFESAAYAEAVGRFRGGSGPGHRVG